MLETTAILKPTSLSGRKMADTEEAKELRKLIKAIQQFTLLNPKMSAQTILAFLHVAVDEGKSLSDYVAASRLPQSTISTEFVGPRNVNTSSKR